MSLPFAIPAAAKVGAVIAPAVLKFFGGLFGGNAKEKAAKDQARLQNEFVQKSDAAKAKILEMLQASGWNPTGVNRLNSGGTSTTSQSSFVRPEILAAYKGIEGKLKNLVEGRLGRGQYSNEEFVKRNLVNKVRAINAANAGADAAVRNSAGQGLSQGQRAALAQQANMMRTGAIVDEVGSVPMQARALEDQAFAMGQGLTEAFGKGTRTNSTSTTNSSDWREVGPDIGAAMGLFGPTAPMSSMETGRSKFGEILGGAGDLAGALSQYGASRGWFNSTPKPNAAMMNLWNNAPGFWSQ